MPVHVLSPMQNAHHVKHVRSFPNIDHVRSSPRLACAGAQLDGPAGRLARGQRQADPVQLVDVAVGLVGVPVLSRVVPDLGRSPPSRGRET